jgi:hypothetical protein
MPLSSFIDINSKRYKFIKFKFEVKDMVHDRIVKLRATNNQDENMAIVLDDNNDKQVNPNYKRQRQHKYYERNKQKLSQYFHEYYSLNRKDILQKKKEYNKQPHVKQHNSEYHKNYYLKNKEELKSKHREYHHNRSKKNDSKMSRA